MINPKGCGKLHSKDYDLDIFTIILWLIILTVFATGVVIGGVLLR